MVVMRTVPLTLAGPAPASEDRRTTALMTPVLGLLDSLGVLAGLKPKAAPLKVMRIVDATNRLIRGPVVTFRAAEIGEEHFGLNIPNRDLNAALEEVIQQQPAIEWRRSIGDALLGSWEYWAFSTPESATWPKSHAAGAKVW